MIYYNITLLSKLLVIKQQQGDLEVAQRLSHISPVAWQHVNFHGRYEFTNIPTSIDLDALIAQLASRPLVLDDSD